MTSAVSASHSTARCLTLVHSQDKMVKSYD
jgi:hypothetical protein